MNMLMLTWTQSDGRRRAMHLTEEPYSSHLINPAPAITIREGDAAHERVARFVLSPAAVRKIAQALCDSAEEGRP